MKKNEIMENVQLNEEGRKKRLFLVLVASLLAVGAAIFGLFRFGKSAKAEAKKARRTGKKKHAASHEHTAKERKSSASETSAPVVQTVQVPVAQPQQPVYIVRPLPEKKPVSRAKRFRRRMCASVAAILVLSVVIPDTLQYIPAPQIEAKERTSFSGISRVVSDHTEEPYVILNIVAYGSERESRTATMGSMDYLSGGQQIVYDLKETFESSSAYYSYDARVNLADSMLSVAPVDINYKERYEGVDNVSGSNWIQVFDAQPQPVAQTLSLKQPVIAIGGIGNIDGIDSTDSTGSAANENNTSPAAPSINANAATGYFYALADYSETPDANHNFELVSSVDGKFVVGGMLQGGEYAYSPDGQYQLAFDYTGSGSYKVVDTKPLSEANGLSWAYKFEDGVWKWTGETVETVLNRLNSEKNQSEENTESGKKDEVTEEPEEPEEPEEGEGNETEIPEDPKDPDDENDPNASVTPNPDEPITPGASESGDDQNNTDDIPGETNPPTGSDSSTEGNNNGNSNESSTTSDTSTSTPQPDGDSGNATNAILDDASRNIPVLGRWYKLVADGEGELTNTVNAPSNDGSDGSQSADTTVPGTDDTNTGGSNGSTTAGIGSTQPSEGNENQPQESEEIYAVVFFGPAASSEEGQYSCVSEVSIEYIDGIVDDTYDMVGDGDEYDTVGINADGGIKLFSAGGSERPVDGSFVYVGEGQGHYKLTRINEDSVVENANMAGYAAISGAAIYIGVDSFENTLLKYVFSTLSGGDNQNDKFKIEVVTLRADQVEPDDVFAADLIYLEDNDTIGGSGTDIFNDSGDMSSKVVSAILYRVTQELVPIIVDYQVALGGNGTYSTTHYSLLAQALQVKDVDALYHAANKGIPDPSKGDTDDDDNSGSGSGSGSGSTGDDDFVDNLGRGIADDKNYPKITDNELNFVNRNIYMHNDVDGLVNKFTDEVQNLGGFSEVLTAIKAENLLLPDDNKLKEEVSKAKIIQYIINYSVGMIGEFDDLVILELQPTANSVSDLSTETDSKGYTKLLWKTQSMTAAKQVLSSKKEFSVVKDIKSVAEFNGEWEDLNSTYDFIFIGLDGQRLNLGDNGKAKYNNDSLNGKVYHPGDDSGAGTYDANDITPQKMTDLIEYLKAGYPIVVEDDFFTTGSAQYAKKEDINTDYIHSDTFMYRFLQVALDEYKDCIYSVSDTMSSAMFMTEVRLAKPVVNVIDENGNAAGKLQTLVKGENGEYRGIINYEIKNRQGDDYQGETLINLYVDYNFDGMFTVEELVTEYAGGSGTIDVAADGMDAGILPWKLEVTDANNTNRRDSVQGYFVPSSPAEGELKVLQVTEKLNDDNVNLQRIFQYENSLLAYYLHSAESSLNTTMQFETVSAGELETLLGENSKYLELYDVVVLTMDGSADSGAVTQAVTDYVNAGRSLLVCNQGVETPMARMGLSPELLGQSDNGTFTNLGYNSGRQYFRYAGLTRDMFEAATLLMAEPINDGSISYYPYQIGASVSFGDKASLKASPYLLDFEGNLASEPNATYVTAWYTFGSAAEASAYGISPRDARNNYYCYSKGNVVYLAQSEYPYIFDSKDIATANGEGATESMMFVNALMAAYNAGVHNANIHIVAGFAPDSAEIESIAVPFDDIWLEAGDSTAGILDNTVDVYFRFRDSNIARNKEMLISFLYEDPTGPELDIGGRVVNARPFASPIWTVEEGRLSLIGDVGEDGLTLTGDNQLKTGQTYRIQAPVVTLKGNENMNKADIYIVIQTSFTKSGKDYSVISSDVVSLNRAQLFLLE